MEEEEEKTYTCCIRSTGSMQTTDTARIFYLFVFSATTPSTAENIARVFTTRIAHDSDATRASCA